MTARWIASGDWPSTTLGAALSEAAERRPAATAVADARVRWTYAELDRRASAAAGRLAAIGVRAGDVVSWILPNRAEALALFFAARRIGAIANPIVPIYRGREIEFILRQTDSRAVFVPGRFGGVDFPALVDRLRTDLPARPRIVDVDGAEGRDFFTPSADRAASRARVDPDAVAAILYTSGTTADPKGVLHSDHTLLSLCHRTRRQHGLGAEEVFVIASPASHISGLLYGVMLPVVLGARSVLMESWDPEAFLALVASERGTFSVGATPYLQSILDSPTLERHDLRSLRVFPCGGAEVPPALIRRAIHRLGIRTGRGYGSTEFPTITSSSGPEVPEDKRAETDGRPVPPNELEIRDDRGRVLGAGEEGEIWARGPALCLGYRDPSLDAAAFDERGFFATGDLGMLDRDGYLTVTGRLKDVIVRGGEKFSAKEIEDLLFLHPKVKSVAIVPVPDPALGERACAVVVAARRDDPPSLAELVAFLAGFDVSRRKLPERLELVEELPTTASGKVHKQALRARLAGKPAADSAR